MGANAGAHAHFNLNVGCGGAHVWELLRYDYVTDQSSKRPRHRIPSDRLLRMGTFLATGVEIAGGGEPVPARAGCAIEIRRLDHLINEMRAWRAGTVEGRRSLSKLLSGTGVCWIRAFSSTPRYLLTAGL